MFTDSIGMMMNLLSCEYFITLILVVWFSFRGISVSVDFIIYGGWMVKLKATLYFFVGEIFEIKASHLSASVSSHPAVFKY